ncbi:hypothetical protein DOTSEDRAFT_137527, partial [Dothistroma septosporum NZE10]
SCRMDNVFEQLDAKASCLQRELANSNPTLPQLDLEVVLQLVQFPKLFRPAFGEFIATLPVTISISDRSLVTSRVTGTTSDRRRSADYVGYQCAFKMPDGADCLTWTSIPYVTDTYFTGLAKILAAAGDPSSTANELETQIKTGLKFTFCHHHTEQEKTEQAHSLALPIRHVATRWRTNERRWREVGKTSLEQLARPAGPNGTSRSRRDDSAVWSSSSSSTASDRAERETEGLKEQIRYLREENHRLREEVADLSGRYRHEH